jgi:inner membrane protein
MLLFAHLGLTLAGARLMRDADLGFVLLGSMLPDIIDKPLGEVLFGTPAMGRTIAHTLLFLLLLGTVAFYLRDLRMASVAGGVLAHLLLDFIWNMPSTLLWPLLGGFPIAADLSTLDYLQVLLQSLGEPMVAVPEILGLAYLLYFAWIRRAEIRCLKRRVLGQMQLLRAWPWQ